uniref:Transmembrane domain containing protein n=1 Tax=Marseillevirus sp. TaxID=2809551 RepID=A0AA96J327_9VIRU|nr:transmembrane domain containing protein [Marseillevirus sp.]
MSCCTEEKFWAEDLCDLFCNLSIIPKASMSFDAKLNAITRLVIIISVIAYFLKYQYWYIFLLVSLGVIILFKYSRKEPKKEGFTIPQTNLVGSQIVSTIPPVLGEQWENPSPTYNNYTLLADEQGPNCSTPPTFDESAFPVYGQYYTQSNLQPFRDEELRNQSLVDSTVQMNNAFLSDQLQFRNDYIRLFQNRLRRENANTSYEAISPI